jgi:hypothetical protein
MAIFQQMRTLPLNHFDLVLYHWKPQMRTQSQRTKVVLLLAAIFVVPLFLWYFVLNNVAVNRSISLAPGTTVTQDFWVNYRGFYRLGIVADRKYPHRELQCLLGINDAYGVKDCDERRLKYSRTLSCSGARETYSGASDKIFGGAYARDWMETEFGGFEAKHWERCHLRITIADGSPLLADANPKLRVFTELF